MPINAIIYARTSPDCLVTAEDQIDHLKTVAADHGWTVTNVFTDRPMPVKKGREKRPGEVALLDTIRAGGVQKVLLWNIDRVGRSLDELVNFVETCRAAGVGLYLHQQKLDTAGSNGMSLFDVAGMMAFHLRQSRRDRILRGQAAARAASVRFGRPPIVASKVERAKQALAVGKLVREVARLAGISAASVSRLKGTMEQMAAAADQHQLTKRYGPMLADNPTFWGKARPSNTAGAGTHPLLAHSLDVAAVALLLPRRLTFGLTGQTMGFLVALDHIGKFSRPFQAQAPEYWPTAVLGSLTARIGHHLAHGTMRWAFTFSATCSGSG